MNKLKPILQFIFFTGIGVLLVWFSLRQIPANKWQEFKASLTHAKYWLIVPVFFILTASHVLRSLRWKLLMKPLGYAPKILNVFFSVMIGYLANLAVPRLGELLKCTILARYEKVPADKLVGTIVAERAVDIVSLVIMFIVALAVQYDVVVSNFYKVLQKTSFIKEGELSVIKILEVFGVIIIILSVVWWLISKYKHVSFIKKVRGVVRGIITGLISIKHLKHKMPFILYSAGIWILYLAGTWIGFYATQSTEHLGLSIACSSLVFGALGMIATPGGIGAYAFFIALVLEENNVSFEHGYANGTLQWFAQVIIVLVIGFISLGLLPIYNKKKLMYEAN